MMRGRYSAAVVVALANLKKKWSTFSLYQDLVAAVSIVKSAK